MDIRKINDALSVSPQIRPADMEKIKQAGFVAIVNNRPDGEEAGQPLARDIAAAAREHGIPVHHVPVTRPPFDADSLQRVRDILREADGPVLFFCRTGTRCTNLWALAHAGELPGEDMIDMAFDAGYDISALRDQLK